MARFFVTLILCAISAQLLFADNSWQTDRYIKETEYYQRKAESHRKEAAYHLKKAESYQREAAYYTRKGKTETAKGYQRKAEREKDFYRNQLNYAAKIEVKAADYLKRASNLLKNYIR